MKDPGFTYLPVIFGEDNDQCRTPEVQSLAAMFMLYMNLASGILSAIVSPRLGHLSDRYGRKTLMALSSICTLVGEAVTIIVASRPESSSAYLLLVAAFIDGLGGSFTSSIALVHSYASDCTPPERRNVVFGYFHATIFSGIALGPFLFGLMIKLTGSVLAVFYTVAGCHLFYFMIIAFAIPESVSKDRQRAARERHRVKHLDKEGGLSWSSVKDLNPINIVRPLSILFPKFEHSQLWSSERRKTLGHLRRNLILLASIDTLLFGVTMGAMQIILLYAEYMFGWHDYESSIFLSMTSTGRVIILLIVFPIITLLTRGPQRTEQTNSGSDRLDIGVIQLSIIFDLAGYIGYCLAGSGGVFLLSGVVSSASSMGSPTLQSSLTKHVPPSHTGQILGATGLLHALARVVSPVIFNVIYSRTVHKFPQTVFVCLGSVFGLAFVLSLFLIPNGMLPSHSLSPQDILNTNAVTKSIYRQRRPLAGLGRRLRKTKKRLWQRDA